MALTIMLVLSGSVLATFLGLNLFNFLKRMIAQNKAKQMKHIHSARASQGKANSKQKISRQERRAARQVMREQRKAARETKKEQQNLQREAKRTQKAQEKEIAKKARAIAKSEKQAAHEQRKAQKDLEKRTKYNTENIKLASEVDNYMRKIVDAKVQEATELRSRGKNLSKADKTRLRELEKEIDIFMQHNDLDPQPTILPEKEKKVKEHKIAETLLVENQGFAHETINQKAQRATELANKPFLTMTDRKELATLQDELTTFYAGNPKFEKTQSASAQSAEQIEATTTAEIEKQKTESRARRFARGVKNKAGQILSADLGNDHHHDNTLHYSP